MLPRDSSIRQLKMLRDLTKGTDIGDITAKDRLNMDQPNLQYVGNPIDKHIDSYEEFEEKDNKLQTIAFKSKLVNKPLIKEHYGHKMVRIKCPFCDETNAYEVDRSKKDVRVTCHDCRRTIAKTIKENNNNDMKDSVKTFEEFYGDTVWSQYDRDGIVRIIAEYLEKPIEYVNNWSMSSLKEFWDDNDLEQYASAYIRESFYGSFADWYSENKDSETLRDEYREYVDEVDEYGEKPITFRQWCKERYNSLINESKENTGVFSDEKEPKSNPNFGYAAVRDQEIKKIAFFNNFQIDPPTPKERSFLNVGQFIDNDKVKGIVNRIEGKNVYVESLEEPMVIKKFNLSDAVKTKKE